MGVAPVAWLPGHLFVGAAADPAASLAASGWNEAMWCLVLSGM